MASEARSASDIVLVTGAAGAIGSATVDVFLRAGFRVVGLDRDQAVASPRKDYVGYVVDLRNEADVDETVGKCASSGAIRHVIGIAGGALPTEPRLRDLTELTLETFRGSLEENLTSQFIVIRAVLPLLRRSLGDRSITVTSSFNALGGWGMPAYSAAKAGLIGLVYALTGPLGADGIRINAVAPGTIPTPRTRRIWADEPGHFESLTDTTALGRLGTPEDVARTFLSLATVLTHITGQVLVVDGGQTIKRVSAER